MSGGVNKVFIMGRLGRDPETRSAGDQTVCSISVATDESWTDKSGEKQTRTEWHRGVCWGKRGEALAKYFKKGEGIYFEGRLQTRSWEDKETKQKRYATEIVIQDWQFLPGSRDGGGGERQERGGRQERDEPPGRGDWGGPGPGPGVDDDIPF